MGDESELAGLASRTAWLAPLSGITDVFFRRIASRYGAGLVVSEMVASEEYVRGFEEARLRAEGLGMSPHVVQLAGRDPIIMADAARLAAGAGATIVDINMGCPAKRVTGGLAGSGLMRDVDLAQRIIAAVANAVSIPVTVKMRLGWDHANLCAPDLAARAVAVGARAITVHGRTRQQFYTGAADWAAIAPVIASAPVPVIANGDIASLETAQAALSASGAASVMVGRAALGRPWLVGQIAAGLRGVAVAEPSPGEKAAVAVEHYEGLLGLYGHRLAIRHARKHLAAYAEEARRIGCGLAERDRIALVTSDCPKTVVGLIRRSFDDALREAA